MFQNEFLYLELKYYFLSKLINWRSNHITNQQREDTRKAQFPNFILQ